MHRLKQINCYLLQRISLDEMRHQFLCTLPQDVNKFDEISIVVFRIKKLLDNRPKSSQHIPRKIFPCFEINALREIKIIIIVIKRDIFLRSRWLGTTVSIFSWNLTLTEQALLIKYTHLFSISRCWNVEFSQKKFVEFEDDLQKL